MKRIRIKKFLLFLVTFLFILLLLFTYMENNKQNNEMATLNKQLNPLIYKKNKIEKEINSIETIGCGVVTLVVSGDFDYIYSYIYPTLEYYNMDAALVVGEDMDSERLGELENAGWEFCDSVQNELFEEICPKNNEKQIHIYSKNIIVPEDYFNEDQWPIKMMRWNNSGVVSFMKSAVRDFTTVAFEVPVYNAEAFDTETFASMLDNLKEYIEVNRLKILTPSDAYDFIENQEINMAEQNTSNENKKAELTKELELINQEIEELYNSYR